MKGEMEEGVGKFAQHLNWLSQKWGSLQLEMTDNHYPNLLLPPTFIRRRNSTKHE
jgi:hypothetical protein